MEGSVAWIVARRLYAHFSPSIPVQPVSTPELIAPPDVEAAARPSPSALPTHPTPEPLRYGSTQLGVGQVRQARAEGRRSWFSRPPPDLHWLGRAPPAPHWSLGVQGTAGGAANGEPQEATSTTWTTLVLRLPPGHWSCGICERCKWLQRRTDSFAWRIAQRREEATLDDWLICFWVVVVVLIGGGVVASSLCGCLLHP